MSQPTAFQISDLVRRWVEHQFGPHARPGRVVIDLIGAPPVTIPILGQGPPTAEAVRTQPAVEAGASQSGDDFRSVLWHGQVYAFSAAQAKVVAALWAARENGQPDVPDDQLVRASGAANGKLDNVFKGSPAWGTLITEGDARGTHRIAPPSPE